MVLVQPDGWARGEREGYGEPCDVTSLSLSLSRSVIFPSRPRYLHGIGWPPDAAAAANTKKKNYT